MRGRTEYMPPTFMTVNVAARQLLDSVKEMASEEPAQDGLLLNENSICVGLARIGAKTQQIVKATLAEMCEASLGPPLHSLIIVGKLHSIEIEMLKLFE